MSINKTPNKKRRVSTDVTSSKQRKKAGPWEIHLTHLLVSILDPSAYFQRFADFFDSFDVERISSSLAACSLVEIVARGGGDPLPSPLQMRLVVFAMACLQSKEKCFGQGDYGSNGISRFFQSHSCNSYCHVLGLPAGVAVEDGALPKRHALARAATDARVVQTNFVRLGCASDVHRALLFHSSDISAEILQKI